MPGWEHGSCIHNTDLQSVSEEVRKASQIETDSNSSGYVADIM